MTETTCTDTTTDTNLIQHLDCVTLAATGIISSTCGLDPQPVEEREEDVNGESLILGVISLMGDVEWSLFLGLPTATATAFAAKFAGFEIPFDSPDMGDAVGELTNIFAGQVKTLLDGRGVKANISLPSVLRAEHIKVLIQRDSTSKRLCFETPVGRFWTGILVGKAAGIPA